jgi:hypothetical protein
VNNARAMLKSDLLKYLRSRLVHFPTMSVMDARAFAYGDMKERRQRNEMLGRVRTLGVA